MLTGFSDHHFYTSSLNECTLKTATFMQSLKQQQSHLDVHFFSHSVELVPMLEGQHTANLHLLHLCIGGLVGLDRCGPVSPELRQSSSLPSNTYDVEDTTAQRKVQAGPC